MFFIALLLLCVFVLIVLIENVETMDFCTMELSEARLGQLQYAVMNYYWYQMYIGKGCGLQ